MDILDVSQYDIHIETFHGDQWETHRVTEEDVCQEIPHKEIPKDVRRESHSKSKDKNIHQEVIYEEVHVDIQESPHWHKDERSIHIEIPHIETHENICVKSHTREKEEDVQIELTLEEKSSPKDLHIGVQIL